MKSVLFTLAAVTVLTACGKKEEAPAPVVAPAPATAVAPTTSEPAKTEETKK